MAQGTHLYFVTWPDGKVDEGSVNIYSKGHAICWFIRTFLPERWFGDMNGLISPDSYMTQQLFQGMKEKGFKVHDIEVPKPTPEPAP